MRTTLDLDDSLLRAAKERAARDGITLTRLIESALRDSMKPTHRPGRPFRLKIQVSSARPLPGVDFDDRDSLYQRMGERL